MVIFCQFGDATFKYCVSNVAYRIQVLHHALLFKAKYVFFVSSNAHHIIFVAVIKFDKATMIIYKNMLSHFVQLHLSWTTCNNSIPVKKLSEKGLSGKGYHVDVQSIQVYFGLLKSIHQIVL